MSSGRHTQGTSSKYAPGTSASYIPTRQDTFKNGTMYHLVVCGADYSKPLVDAALFGSFMGEVLSWKMLTEDIAYAGEFLSVFPLNKYFAMEPHKDIKFGQTGPKGTPLFTYTEKQFSTRQGKFFEQVDPDDLAQRVRKWMVETIGKAVQGDVVNIGFHCHGAKNGDLLLGKKLVPAETIANKATSFRDGVQVNIHGTQCYGGKLVNAIKSKGAKDIFAEAAAASDEMSYTAVRSVSNRCRQMAFSQPWVQSYAKIKLPHLQQTAYGAPVTVEQHENWLTEALRNITPNNTRSAQTYTAHLSSDKEKAQFLLEDMTLRSHVDITLNKTALVHRRRRAEWPIFSVPDLNRLRANQNFAGDSDQRIALQTLRFIDEDLWQHMNTELPLHEDDWIAAEMRKAPRDSQGHITGTKGVNVRGLMANAWFRAREQSAIMDIWIAFMERGLLSTEGLVHRISWYTNDENVVKVANVLTFFSGIKSSRDGPYLFPNQQRIENSWYWLAIQIVRSGIKQAGLLIDLLHWTEILGTFDEKAFFHRYPNGIEWEHDPLAFSTTRDKAMGKRAKRYYAEWLPHAIDNDDIDEWAQAMLLRWKHFERIERYYYRYFSVPENQAITEAEQSTAISKRLVSEPWIEPGRKHSGAWRPGDPEDPQ